MTRRLLPTPAFTRAAKRITKKNARLAESLRTTLALLSANAYHPQLQTHKLKGDLTGSWACSAGYDLRIIFEFVQYEETEAILLQTVGTHDDVY